MSITQVTLRLAAASLAVTLSLATPVSAQSEQLPKPGGTLEVGTVYVTLPVLSWDSADWNWKHNHDTGQVYEQLFVADLRSPDGSAASIRSMPMPGFLRMRFAANLPRNGNGSKTRFASKSTCARA